MKPRITVKVSGEINSACQWLNRMLYKGVEGGKPVIVTLSRESRTEAQNRHMWPLIRCFTEQKQYNGSMWPDKAWKMILLSAYLNDTSGIVIGINGEVINTNLDSSGLSKPAFSEFIEAIYAQGCGWGIVWSDPALKAYEEWGMK